MVFISSNKRLYIGIESGEKIDLMDGVDLTAKAKAYLTLHPVTLTYQLAEPILIPLPEQMTPNTIEIARLSELTNKLTNAIISLGGTIGMIFNLREFIKNNLTSGYSNGSFTKGTSQYICFKLSYERSNRAN